MKKIITIICILIGTSVQAQHKPLKHIDINSVYISQSGSQKSYNIGNTREIYTSFFYLHRNSISHHKGIQSPDLGYELWEIDTRIDSDEVIALKLYTTKKELYSNFYTGLTKLSIIVGGSSYAISSWYYSDMMENHTLMIDINKNIAEHISISGLQGICVDGIELISFSDIEQELWRRAAEDVYETCKDK